jgi:hypothetical protein
VAHRAELGHPIALADRGADALLGSSGELGVERCRAGDHQLDLREVPTLHLRGGREAEDHGRRDVQPRDAVLFDDVEELLEVEAGHGDDRRPLGETQVEHDGLPVDVEEGQQADQHVLL